MTNEEHRYLTRQEAADRARVSLQTINRVISSGALRAGGTYRVTRIKPEWVDEWLEKPRPTRKKRTRPDTEDTNALD